MRHHSGKDYIKVAEKNGLKVVSGKGDHFKVYGPDGSHVSIPLHRELATGTDHSILKFFIRFGIMIAGLVWTVWRFQ